MEYLFWTLGADNFYSLPPVLWGMGLLFILALMATCILLPIRSINFFIISITCGAVAVFSGVSGVLIWNYLPPSTQEQKYISEEHKLASVGNLREQEESSFTSSGIFYYASTTTIENVETIRFIRENYDERGTYYTVESRPISEVRVYQANDESPVERHWHTRLVAINPDTGKEYHFRDRLDLIEIKVPEGSVANNYEISIEQ